MSIMMYMLRHAIHQSPYAPRVVAVDYVVRSSSSEKQPESDRMKEFRKKLREKPNIEGLEHSNAAAYEELEPLEKHPGGVNPVTGEIGGPAGPEPTRYGDWERKGRVSDF
ncbi:succinate dehydrogenase assembly factor 4, mitochondrial-like isoform X2 [Atheta coriaria]|uniref:succinate dehydrogenase assembly factor 4, mitochondrial-like isoform X2 n=1 Tax=Dalotia coriaria TaxID=877792 RepID=UPI0031F40DB5